MAKADEHLLAEWAVAKAKADNEEQASQPHPNKGKAGKEASDLKKYQSPARVDSPPLKLVRLPLSPELSHRRLPPLPLRSKGHRLQEWGEVPAAAKPQRVVPNTPKA